MLITLGVCCIASNGVIRNRNGAPSSRTRRKSSDGNAESGRGLKKSRSAGRPYSVLRRVRVSAHSQCGQDLGTGWANSHSSTCLSPGQNFRDLRNLGQSQTAAAESLLLPFL